MDNLHDPSLIPNIDYVCDIIKTHIKWGNKIYCYGDFDVDGTTSTAIIYLTLKNMGANVEGKIASRKKGYGLNFEDINRIYKCGGKLIITLDCGISNHKEIKYANNKGIDVIVIDHHEADSPPDTPFVDLKVDSGGYPFKYLSGAGITWKVCQHLIQRPLYNRLDLVAFSTIADVVELEDENRIIAKYGLKEMTNSSNIGLKALYDVIGIRGEITSGKVGFQIAPLVNAQGRLGDNNQLSFELLTTDLPQEAERMAKELYNVNKERKQISDKALQIAKKQINEEHNIYVIQTDTVEGIVGLIAGDIKEAYHKPTIVLSYPDSEGICKGSCRSIPPLHIRNTLKRVDDLLIKFGGHAMASGLSIHKDNIPEFIYRLNEICRDIKYKNIKYDMELDTKNINKKLVKELQLFQPCGNHNPNPKFLIEDKVENVRVISGGKHLLFTIGGVDAIAFSMGNKKNNLFKSKKVIGTLSINEYRGKNNVQIRVRKIF